MIVLHVFFGRYTVAETSKGRYLEGGGKRQDIQSCCKLMMLCGGASESPKPARLKHRLVCCQLLLPVFTCRSLCPTCSFPKRLIPSQQEGGVNRGNVRQLQGEASGVSEASSHGSHDRPRAPYTLTPIAVEVSILQADAIATFPSQPEASPFSSNLPRCQFNVQAAILYMLTS